MHKKRSVGIIGTGHVGAHTAYSIAIQGIADEIILVDINREKANSERQDIFDSLSFLPHKFEVHTGDYKDLGSCDVIINAAGKVDILINNNDRLQEMRYTISAVNNFADKVMSSGFNGIIISVSNPCDVVARQFAKLSGLPRGHVMGTGTALDTARLLSALARITGINTKSICAYVMGEHGASQMAAWSAVSFGGKSLDSLAKFDAKFQFDRKAVQIEAREAGWVTFAGKNCTEYGICSAAAKLTDAVLHDEKIIMPVSAELSGEYGENDIFIGVPALIGANGVEKVIELDLSPEDLSEFKKCCADVRENIRHAEKI